MPAIHKILGRRRICLSKKGISLVCFNRGYATLRAGQGTLFPNLPEEGVM